MSFFDGLTDHNVQILTLNNISTQNQINYTETIRKINKYSITEFLSKLSYESGETFSLMMMINIYKFFKYLLKDFLL